MIRPATSADTPRLVEMTTRFLETTPYGVLFAPDPACIAHLVGVVLEHGIIFVADTKRDTPSPGLLFPQLIGMIALTSLPHLLTGEPFGDELAWWVEPEHRGGTVGPRLMRSAEAWARENGLKMIKMIAPEGSDVGKFYTRQGYEAIETTFVKVL